jgi:hypothetical protein
MKPGVFYEFQVAPDRTDIGMRDSHNRVILIGKKAEGVRQVISLFSLILRSLVFCSLSWQD